jgi:pSer/pThr/pTyr-binding forkhead associated (FHA) protein
MPEQKSTNKKARLILKMGGTAREFEFTENVITIGRTPENDIQISFDKRASRKHALVEKRDNDFFIKDLESRNGTFVNGKPVKGEVQVFSGDILTAGETDIRLEVGDVEDAYSGTMLLDQEEARKMFASQAALEETQEPVWVTVSFWLAIILIVGIIIWAIMNMP